MYGIPLAALALNPAHAQCADPGPNAPVTLASPVTEMRFQGFDVRYTMPQDPVGVVWYFMGTSGIDAELFGDEQTAMLWNLLYAEGFGIVATERTAPANGANWDMWSSWSRNDDAQRVDDLRDELIATTPLRESTPVYLTGFSDGSGMANSFADMAIDHGWPVFAVGVHNGGWGNPPSVPTMLLIGENDSSNVLRDLPGLLNRMDRAGTPYEHVEIPELVMTPEVFLRNEDWDMDKAQALFDDMVDHGLIDRNGVRRVSDANMNSELNRWTRESNESGVSKAAKRVKVVWAMHRYSARFAERECNFVLDNLP